LERALNGTDSPDEPSSATKWKGPEEETINEDDEPTTPGTRSQEKRFNVQQQSHRRELADGGETDET
jgi:hypothetical protein